MKKSSTKAPKVASYDMKKNYMRENDSSSSSSKSPQWPLKKKTLSK